MSVAEQFEVHHQTQQPITREFAEWLSSTRTDDISDLAFVWAQHALLDWFGVTLAGAAEPLTQILIAELTEDQDKHATPPCSIIWHDTKTSLLNAALINGAASHALDYDDVNRRLHGHPTVVVAPVALALGEKLGASGREVLASLVVGTEIACLLAEMAGDGHYEAGWHATGTIGTFGATAAAAYLMKLDADATRRAFGIAASQAAGLKSNFGTMTKPFHAGKAAMNGLLAARIAARGFTANTEAIEAEQGTIDVTMPGFAPGQTKPHPEGYFSIQQTLFKYHAACYMTHASNDAIAELRSRHGVTLDDLESMTLLVHPQHEHVCDIPEPETGLQIKFSIRHCAVMALDGQDTGALATFSDTNANDPRYVEARRKVAVDMDATRDRMTAGVVLRLKDGRTLEGFGDVGNPAEDIDAQWDRLTSKFTSLAHPVVGEESASELIEAIAQLQNANSIGQLLALARP